MNDLAAMSTAARVPKIDHGEILDEQILYNLHRLTNTTILAVTFGSVHPKAETENLLEELVHPKPMEEG